MPTLEWIGKDKVVNHHQEVPFKVLEHIYNYDENGASNDESLSQNKIIRGDNLEALKALLPQYEGKIKCIYIDPPYNTGNEKWVYNDNVNHPKIKKWLGEVVGREGEDLSRHDKWLCMMYPRLKLLQKLLADDGAIFISIDDNEQANLKLICDEIFGASNFIAEIIVISNSAKNNANYVSVTHEYIITYAKNISNLEKNWLVKKNNVEEFKRRANIILKSELNDDEIHVELLNLIKYPRFYDFDHYTNVDEKGPFRASDLTAPNSKSYFDILHPTTKLPCRTGTRGWAFQPDKIKQLINENRIYFGKDEKTIPQLKNHLQDNETQIPKSVMFFDTQATTKWIKSNKFNFDFPKPIELIEHIISMFSNKNSIILDSFAGSGTTAHAVLNMNKQDSGNRKFILIEMEDYAETITAERVKRVINGYADVQGTGGSFNFYDLGQPLLLENQYINEEVDLKKIREYVFFMETKQLLEKAKNTENGYYLGRYNDAAYYFYYEKEKITTLNHKFLSEIKAQAESYIIYADKNSLSKDEMNKYKVTFKKIPRDIARL
jgi:adenine-specific DNA-methyltransferase